MADTWKGLRRIAEDLEYSQHLSAKVETAEAEKAEESQAGEA